MPRYKMLRLSQKQGLEAKGPSTSLPPFPNLRSTHVASVSPASAPACPDHPLRLSFIYRHLAAQNLSPHLTTFLSLVLSLLSSLVPQQHATPRRPAAKGRQRQSREGSLRQRRLWYRPRLIVINCIYGFTSTGEKKGG